MAIQQMVKEPTLYEMVGGNAPHAATPRSALASIDETQTAVLRLDLLGSPQASLAGRPIVLRTRKTLALLGYLAIERGPHPREQLADLLWPDADMEDARASLRTTLSYVRQALGADTETYLAATRETVGITPSAPVDLDLQGLAEARWLLRRSPAPAILRRQIETAIERSRGTFLDGLSLPDAPDFEAWIHGQRTYWQGIEGELLDRLATLQVQDGDFDTALAALERWTSINPDEESAWQRLIDLHLQREDLAGARRAWKAYRGELDELDAEPSPAMALLADRINGATTLRRTSVDPLSASGELDFKDLPLVGRDREYAQLLAAYERSKLGRPEVVIVEGASGIGKTRLVSQVLESVQHAGADVLVGRAFETMDELPYAALVEALRARLEEENAPDDLLSDIWLAELARLVPELWERYPDLPLSANDPTLGRGRLFEAVALLGRELAERKPLVLYIDDVQWTDVATRDFLRYAVRRWTDTETRALVILAVESETLRTDLDLAQWLGGLQRDTPTVRLALTVLERAHVLQLINQIAGRPLDSDATGDTQASISDSVTAFGEWLAERTSGHPGALVQAMRRLIEENLLRVRPNFEEGWVIDTPDVRNAQHAARLESVARTIHPTLITERMTGGRDVEREESPAVLKPDTWFNHRRENHGAAVDDHEALRALDMLVRERVLREMGRSSSILSLLG